MDIPANTDGGFKSVDGLCAITIDVKPGAIGDVTNFLAISRAARKLLDVCVVDRIAAGKRATGGTIGPIGRPNHAPSIKDPCRQISQRALDRV